VALFTKATKANSQAHFKAGFKGFQGSGKTLTTYYIAEGLSLSLSPPKGERMPILMADTEKGSSFLVPLADKAKIDIMVMKSLTFESLMKLLEEGERLGAIVVVDSITRFWVQLAKDLRVEKSIEGMAAPHYQKLNDLWTEFADRFVNSNCHSILCARAGWEYDESMDAEGNKTLEKLRTKMKGASEMGFEPSLLVEMIQEPSAKGKARGAARLVKGRLWDYVAYIEKDRSRTINGQRIVNPTFESFRPHIEFLNLGGKHVAVDTTGDSRALFRKKTEPEEAV
jgi:hypothetical protein